MAQGSSGLPAGLQLVKSLLTVYQDQDQLSPSHIELLAAIRTVEASRLPSSLASGEATKPQSVAAALADIKKTLNSSIIGVEGERYIPAIIGDPESGQSPICWSCLRPF